MSAAEDERLRGLAEECQADICCRLCRDVRTGDHPTTAGADIVFAALRDAIEPVAKQRDEAAAFLRTCLVRPRPEGLRRRQIEALLANIAAEGGKEETK